MIKEQFESLIYRLSLYFQDSTNEDKIELFIEKAKNENAWFSDSLIRDAMKAIDWKTPQAWSFEPIDNEKFPAVDLARRCGALGGAVAAMYNAANEVAVAAFMKEEIPFTAIVDTIEKTVTKLGGQAQSVVRDIKDVSAIENDARRVAQEALAKR